MKRLSFKQVSEEVSKYSNGWLLIEPSYEWYQLHAHREIGSTATDEIFRGTLRECYERYNRTDTTPYLNKGYWSAEKPTTEMIITGTGGASHEIGAEQVDFAKGHWVGWACYARIDSRTFVILSYSSETSEDVEPGEGEQVAIDAVRLHVMTQESHLRNVMIHVIERASVWE